jgi:hypothetical protein
MRFHNHVLKRHNWQHKHMRPMNKSAPNNSDKIGALLGLQKGDIIVGWNGPRLLSSKTLFVKTFHKEIFEAWSVFVFNSSIAKYLTSYYQDSCHCNYRVFIFYEHEQNHNP